MFIKNFDNIKIIIIIFIIFSFFYLQNQKVPKHNKITNKSTKKINLSSLQKKKFRTNEIYKQNYKLLMKNIKYQKNILKKLKKNKSEKSEKSEKSARLEKSEKSVESFESKIKQKILHNNINQTDEIWRQKDMIINLKNELNKLKLNYENNQNNQNNKNKRIYLTAKEKLDKPKSSYEKSKSSYEKSKSSYEKSKSSYEKPKSSYEKPKSSYEKPNELNKEQSFNLSRNAFNNPNIVKPFYPMEIPQFNGPPISVPPIAGPPMSDPVYIRDNQVLNDKLYPPLGRTERPQFDLLMNFMNTQNGVFNMYTRGPPDTYRILGYLTPINDAQTIDSTLILYGRAKFPLSDLGDFYLTSSSKISDIKIPLTEYNCNIKRIWDIPQIIEIRGSMAPGKYNFTELPKPDLTHPYI
jgi:hypothetical protein